MALYSEKVMDHFMNPRNVGIIENADGVGEVGNAKCGDIMKIYLWLWLRHCLLLHGHGDDQGQVHPGRHGSDQ